MTPDFVLGSASPRRREILETLGLRFVVEVSGADENLLPGEPPGALVQRLAVLKAKGIELAGSRARLPVVGADTVVVVEGDVLGKPEDESSARDMLRRLSGRAHEVYSGVALVRDGECLESITVRTRVVFRVLDEQTVDRYAATREGLDKAGGYGIQGIGSGLVAGIEGSYSNVVGLPAAETVLLLQAHGVVEAWP